MLIDSPFQIIGDSSIVQTVCTFNNVNKVIMIPWHIKSITLRQAQGDIETKAQTDIEQNKLPVTYEKPSTNIMICPPI